MAGPNERELKLKLTFEADASKPSKAMQDIANQAQRTSQAVQDVNRQMQRLQGPGGSAINNAGGGSAWGYSPVRFHQGAGAGPQQVGWALPGGTGGGPVGGSMAAAAAARGAPGMGMMGGAMGAVGMVGGAIGAAAATAALFANSVEAVAKLHDPLATSHAKLLEVARAVPVFGGALSDLVGNMSRAAERLLDWKGSLARDRYADNFPMLMAQDAINASGRERIAGVNRSTRGYGFGLAALQQNPGVAYSVNEVAGAIGGVGGFALQGGFGALDARTQEGLESLQLARRGSSAADMEASAALVDRVRARGAKFSAEQAAAAAAANTAAAGRAAGVGLVPQSSPPASGGPSFLDLLLGGGVSLFGRRAAGGIGEHLAKAPMQGAFEDAKKKEARAVEELIRTTNAATEAEQRYGAATIDSLKKRHEVSKAETALAKTRVDLLQEEYSRVREGSRGFLAMDSVAQRGFADAFDRFKSGGRDSVTAQELQMLTSSGITGKSVGDQLDTEGGTNPLLKRLLDQVGLRDKQFLENEIRNSKIELAGKIQLDEEQAAKVLAKAAEKMNADLTGLIQKIVMAETQKTWIGRAAGNAASGN